MEKLLSLKCMEITENYSEKRSKRLYSDNKYYIFWNVIRCEGEICSFIYFIIEVALYHFWLNVLLIKQCKFVNVFSFVIIIFI